MFLIKNFYFSHYTTDAQSACKHTNSKRPEGEDLVTQHDCLLDDVHQDDHLATMLQHSCPVVPHDVQCLPIKCIAI